MYIIAYDSRNVNNYSYRLAGNTKNKGKLLRLFNFAILSVNDVHEFLLVLAWLPAVIFWIVRRGEPDTFFNFNHPE